MLTVRVYRVKGLWLLIRLYGVKGLWIPIRLYRVKGLIWLVYAELRTQTKPAWLLQQSDNLPMQVNFCRVPY